MKDARGMRTAGALLVVPVITAGGAMAGGASRIYGGSYYGDGAALCQGGSKQPCEPRP